jgi:hypothetical protein
MNEDPMSQQTSESDEDDIPEIALSEGVRGKYYEAYRTGTNVVLLEPAVTTIVRDSAAITQALRQFSRFVEPTSSGFDDGTGDEANAEPPQRAKDRLR